MTKPSHAEPQSMIELDFSKGDGLLPAIVQDWQSGEVLMLAYLDRASWEETLRTGRATFWSRSRRKRWQKGETSGHYQLVREIRIDCDQDAVLFKVEQLGGAACHTGHRSCFYRRVADDGLVTEGQPLFDPAQVYSSPRPPAPGPQPGCDISP